MTWTTISRDLIKVIIANKLALLASFSCLSVCLMLGSSDVDVFGASKVVWFSTDLNFTYFPYL